MKTFALQSSSLGNVVWKFLSPIQKFQLHRTVQNRYVVKKTKFKASGVYEREVLRCFNSWAGMESLNTIPTYKSKVLITFNSSIKIKQFQTFFAYINLKKQFKILIKKEYDV